jgi:hypothetical protein
MQDNNITPNVITYSTAISAVAKAGQVCVLIIHPHCYICVLVRLYIQKMQCPLPIPARIFFSIFFFRIRAGSTSAHICLSFCGFHPRACMKSQLACIKTRLAFHVVKTCSKDACSKDAPPPRECIKLHLAFVIVCKKPRDIILRITTALKACYAVQQTILKHDGGKKSGARRWVCSNTCARIKCRCVCVRACVCVCVCVCL